MQKAIGVVIVNWNSGPFLEKCLKHLGAQTLAPGKILVLDNNSTDGSMEAARNFPGVQLIEMDRNLGFAAANNLAVREYLDTPWVVLLNPDAFPEPGWLEALYAESVKHPMCHAFSSRMLSHDAPLFLDGAGDNYHITGMAWRRGHGRSARGAYEVSDRVFSVCAAAAMYRRQTFLDLNGFDEDLFCYFEDVDLSFRINLAGYTCRYVSGAVVRHVGYGSTARHSEFSLYHGHRNMVWCFLANMPLVPLIIFLPLHILFNLFSILYMMRLGHGRVLIKSKYHALLGMKKYLKKRRARPPHPADTATLLRRISFNPFLRGTAKGPGRFAGRLAVLVNRVMRGIKTGIFGYFIENRH